MQSISSLLQGTEPVKWLFYGDSITHGSTHTFGSRDYSELFSERIRSEMGRRMDIVIKTAISGNNTQSLLDSFDWRVAQFSPQVVFLMIGMNDCSSLSQHIPLDTFAKNLHLLIDKISAWKGMTVLQTTCPILPGTAPDREENFPHFMQAIRDVAEARNTLLVDHETYWKENKNKHFHWMANAFHPNTFGHRAFAHLLFRQLDIFDSASATCRLFVP